MPSPRELPREVQVVVRWGASVLSIQRLSPPRSVVFANGRAGLVRAVHGLDLVTGDLRKPIHAGDTVRAWVGDLEITVDATESHYLAEAAPAERTYAAAAADASSLALHVAALAIVFLLHVPTDPSEMDLESLRLEASAVNGVTVREGDLASDGASAAADHGARAGNDSDVSRGGRAAGSGVSSVASVGRPHEPQEGGRARAAEGGRGEALEAAHTFGIVSLIGADAPTEAGRDAWSSFGGAEGPSWGEGDGVEQGFGGLALSGIGEGGGGRGTGIAVGTGGLGLVGTGPGGGCDAGCVGSGLARTSLRGHGAGQGRAGVRMGAINICGVPVDGSEGVSACAGSTIGRLPPETIQRVVRQSFGRFRICYEQDLRMQPNLHTRVTVSFVIGRDGSVASASASSDASHALSSCVARAFYGLSFPEPAGGVVRVTYPITFTPGESATRRTLLRAG